MALARLRAAQEQREAAVDGSPSRGLSAPTALSATGGPSVPEQWTKAPPSAPWRPTTSAAITPAPRKWATESVVLLETAVAARASSRAPLSAPPAHRLVRFTWKNGAFSDRSARDLATRAGVELTWGWSERDRYHTGPRATPPMVASSETARRFREVLRTAGEARVQGIAEEDITAEYALGRTHAHATLDRDRTETIERDGAARVVAIWLPNLPWQVVRYGGDWKPFHEEHHGRHDTTGFWVGPHRLCPLSNGKWSAHDTEHPIGGLTLWRDLNHALRVAETQMASRNSSRAPSPVPCGPPPADVRVVGWRDGGPVVAFPMVYPDRQGIERSWHVQAYLPSGARRTKGARYRKAEKLILTVTEAGAPLRLGRDALAIVQSLALGAIEELPAEAQKKPTRPVRTPAPFSVGARVRYVGPARPGLEPGAVGVVDFVRHPRESVADLSEIVFANGHHVERVSASDVEGHFHRATPSEAAAVPDPVEPEVTQPAVRAAQARGLVRMLEGRVASANLQAQYARDRAAKAPESSAQRECSAAVEHERIAEAATRKLWVADRIARIHGARAKEAPREPPPPSDPVPEPVDIEDRRAAFQEHRDRRIEGLRHAGERRLAKAEATHETAHQMAERIPLGQPILVDHYSARRDQNYRNKMGEKFRTAFALQDEGKRLIARADSAEKNTAIFSDDPDAIAKLEVELADRTASQEHDKAINRALRAGDRRKLVELGLSPPIIERLLVPDPLGQIGIPSYTLTNNAAQIRRLGARIAELKKHRKQGPLPAQRFGAVEVTEEDDRVRLRFANPDASTRERLKPLLKGSGFHWSPHAKAWQRLANPAAWNAARDLGPRLALELGEAPDAAGVKSAGTDAGQYADPKTADMDWPARAVEP